ncbi:DUF3098 domain-containing protein [Sphingobacterium sp. lm-10]|uniref:DUF3098 domain-containing protein n=1 Tax=Sphingobacterium sp. lm-10 TaxID=2944904 RepID=UPI00201FBC4A|nr:DUF3098 domain-containing protein [Sphingobacterium sp. lm-10]MCL7986815.1 DUF3098 domain-containing protein [Sphingobacterium sp. lm-10]
MAQVKKQPTTKVGSTSKASFVFKKENYQLFVASILVVAIGFILMTGTEDIYSFTKITIAPFVVVLGFALGFVAILYKPKSAKSKEG